MFRKSVYIIMIFIMCIGVLSSCESQDDNPPPLHPFEGKIRDILTGAYHSMVIMDDGSLWAWGSNFYGQLGDGTTETRKSPVLIMENVLMASTEAMTMAVKTDGTLWAWGFNEQGQLGDGTTENRLSPVKIMEDVKFVSVCVMFYTVIIKTDDSLWVWGQDGGGDAFMQCYPKTPTKVMDNVTYVSAGGTSTMAITENNELWGWGLNDYGAVGDGTAETRALPPVKIMDNVTQVNASGTSTLAITADGILWSWGHNEYGNIGDGTSIDRYTPVEIMKDTIYAAGNRAIKTDGSLWAWSIDTHLFSSFGDGSKTPYSPVKVMENVSKVSSVNGLCHTLVITQDGALWAWGGNGSGQLGDPSIPYSRVPIKISKD